MSISEIAEYLAKNASLYPALAEAVNDALPWMDRLRNDRDNVVHYKSKVVVFDTKPASFALLNAAGTNRTEPIPDGGSRLQLQEIPAFVNGQMASLHKFMHVALAQAIQAHALHVGLKMVHVGTNECMQCIGTQTFMAENSIEA